MIDEPSPLVSVIIPCFNAEKHLAETIESVLGQTFDAYEIIVVDDGSTDRSAEVIKSFGSGIKSFHWENKGASAARNKGYELAKGAFVQYLDSDDLLVPSALEKRIETFNHNEADVVYSDWQELRECGENEFQKAKLHTTSLDDVHYDPEIALFTKFWAPPAAYLFKRSVVNNVGGFNESLIFIQDARFVFDAAFSGAKFVKLPELGAYYRIRQSGNLSKSDPRGFLKDVYYNALQVESAWRQRGALNAGQLKALAQNYDYTARNLFSLDYSLFAKSLNSLYTIEPGFRLSWPKTAGLLSRILGYKFSMLIMNNVFPLKKNENGS